MVEKYVTQAEFAEIAGVTPAAVCNATKRKLKPATLRGRIDVNHRAAQDYIKKQDMAKAEEALIMAKNGRTEPLKKTEKTPHLRGTAYLREKRKKEPPYEVTNKSDIEFPEEIQGFLDFTLRDLITKFGTDLRFLDWLNATQKIETINEKRLKNAQARGDLVSKALVKKAVIDEFNSAHLRLMKDGAKSIASGVISKNASGSELSEIEAYVSDILSSFIKPIKRKINKSLKEREVIDE